MFTKHIKRFITSGMLCAFYSIGLVAHADSYMFQEVIAGDTITGTFDGVTLANGNDVGSISNLYITDANKALFAIPYDYIPPIESFNNGHLRLSFNGIDNQFYAERLNGGGGGVFGSYTIIYNILNRETVQTLSIQPNIEAFPTVAVGQSSLPQGWTLVDLTQTQHHSCQFHQLLLCLRLVY